MTPKFFSLLTFLLVAAPQTQAFEKISFAIAIGNYKLITCTPPCSNPLGKDTLRHVNNYRAANNLESLVWNQQLADLAQAQAEKIAVGQASFDQIDYNIVSCHFPCQSIHGVGENLFQGSIPEDLPRVAVNSWIGSVGSNANLLGNYTDGGVGSYQNAQGIWFVTQIFALF
jgi:uncharacterized protein YkwD